MSVNWEWIEGRMAELGISIYQLRRYHNFNYDTIRRWDDSDVQPKPDTLQRLARILRVHYLELIRKLGVTPGDFSERLAAVTAARLNPKRRRKA
jgi:hypothetical protein